ncbi:MAG TPA: hypothetical protein VGJ34_04270 [Gaiellaceae bacterium]|jgi:hypothetical protein
MVNRQRPGLTEAVIVWALFAVVAVEVFVTYARVSSQDLYHVSGSGIEGGASRVLVFLGYPLSIVAVALAAIAAARLGTRAAAVTAGVATVLCATIGFPGVIDQADLDARPVNALAAVGVALALALTIVALVRAGFGPTRPFERADIARALAAVGLLFVALPWIFAEVGFYVSDAPVIGRIFLANQLAPSLGGEPSLHAVHLGRHHGMDGVLLVISALVLSRVPRQMRSAKQAIALAAYLSLMLVYGLANALQDFWTEQLVKRGTVSVRIPSLIRPDLSWAWAAIVTAAALICLAALRVVRVDHPEGVTR